MYMFDEKRNLSDQQLESDVKEQAIHEKHNELDDLFEYEVYDVAYTCHENRNGTR